MYSVILVLAAVSASASSMRRTSSSGAPSRRPTKRTRAPRSCMSGTCESIISTNSPISASTSSFGRFQFSVLNE